MRAPGRLMKIPMLSGAQAGYDIITEIPYNNTEQFMNPDI